MVCDLLFYKGEGADAMIYRKHIFLGLSAVFLLTFQNCAEPDQSKQSLSSQEPNEEAQADDIIVPYTLEVDRGVQTQAVKIDANVTFSVIRIVPHEGFKATQFFYEWRRQGEPTILGMGETFSIDNVRLEDRGMYEVTVRNGENSFETTAEFRLEIFEQIASDETGSSGSDPMEPEPKPEPDPAPDPNSKATFTIKYFKFSEAHYRNGSDALKGQYKVRVMIELGSDGTPFPSASEIKRYLKLLGGDSMSEISASTWVGKWEGFYIVDFTVSCSVRSYIPIISLPGIKEVSAGRHTDRPGDWCG